MNETTPLTSAVPRVPATSPRPVSPQVPRGFWFALALLLVGFAVPLFTLGRFALHSDFYSYIPLIPLVSLHAVWRRRGTFRPGGEPHPRSIAYAAFVIGTVLAVWHVWDWQGQVDPLAADSLAISTTAFLLLLTGTCFWFLDRTTLRALAFPLGLLVFMIPIPTVAMHGIETVMQHGSALVAHALFQLSGTAVFYDDLVFQLPGISLQVAPECSGIRSTMALLIVSVVGGSVFLRRRRHRGLLVLAILPLALLRNGFRIFVIGELCTHYGPQMIESFIHRRGGPFFFALSLVPFFLLLLFLQRREHRPAARRA